jgi:hypothetical protein
MKTKIFRNDASCECRCVSQKIATSAFRVLAMTLWLMPTLLSAQNGVTVSGLTVNSGTVTFNVSWNRDAPNMPALWSDTVWVFVDYNAGGVMKRLPLSGGTATAGTVTKLAGNDQGLRVEGNARATGSFEAEVKLYYDSQTAMSGACAYASNYPPVADYVGDDRVTFKGTPPYDLVLKYSGGGTVTAQSGGTYYKPSSYTLQSFIDKTGAPGQVVRNARPFSPTTWSYGGRIWTDHIVGPDTCAKTKFIASNTSPECAYHVSNDVPRYYYNYPYAIQYASVLCPPPWRIPVQADVEALVSAVQASTLLTAWGIDGGYYDVDLWHSVLQRSYYLYRCTTGAGCYVHNESTYHEPRQSDAKYGYELHCVR